MLKRCVIILFAIGVILSARSDKLVVFAAESPYYASQKFSIEQYKKAIIHNGVLYLSDGQGIPPGYNASLFSVQLDGKPLEQQQFQIRSGVYVESMDLEGTMFMIPEQYQFSWDLVDNSMISMNIEETMDSQGVAGCSLVEEQLSSLSPFSQENAEKPRLNFSEQDDLISSPFPLFKLFSRGGNRKSEVFFDFVSFDSHTFHLYIAADGELSVWNYSKNEKDWMKQWQQVTSFPLDFSGPFWAIQLEKHVYILSEEKNTIYRIEEGALNPLLQLPVLFDNQKKDTLQHLFVVDKDRQQLLFFVPSFSEPDTTTVISVGATTSLRQGLEPALQSVLEMYGAKQE